MKTITTKCFVKSMTEDKVVCDLFEIGQIREFDNYPLFAGLKLFKGKNILFTTKHERNSQTITCTETKTRKTTQLWNFYVLGKF